MKAEKPVSHLLSNSFTPNKMKKVWTSYCRFHLELILTVPMKPITAMFRTNQTCHCKRSVIRQFLLNTFGMLSNSYGTTHLEQQHPCFTLLLQGGSKTENKMVLLILIKQQSKTSYENAICKNFGFAGFN